MMNSDRDEDGDGVDDGEDNCPFTQNSDQQDMDGDEVGDHCDNCVQTSNPDQADSDMDGMGDVCDEMNDAGAEHDGFICDDNFGGCDMGI